LVNVTLPGRRPLEELPKTTHAIARAEKALGNKGRVLVRWSGTEPKLRVMIEGPKKDRIQAMAQDIASEAERELQASPAP
jgi:phosphoglucosamine mutase